MTQKNRACGSRTIAHHHIINPKANQHINTNRDAAGNGTIKLGTTILLLSALGAGLPTQAADAPSANHRISEQSVYSTEELATSLSIPQLPDPLRTLAAQKSGASAKHHPVFNYQDVWISDIGTLLYTDQDRDGYFAGISLSIDADTHYSNIDVYVSIDLQRDYGERERLHTSGNFTLYGNSITDEFRIDIDLVRNYPIGSYNLFVDLHDASTGQIFDRVSASEFSNLSRLPLESEEEDHFASVPAPEPVPGPVRNDDIRVVEYAGGTGNLLIALLGAILFGRVSLNRKK